MGSVPLPALCSSSQLRDPEPLKTRKLQGVAMKQIVVALGIVVLLAALGLGGWFAWNEGVSYAPPPPWTDDMQLVAEGNNHFACDLYGKVADDQKSNVFFSPYSVHTALAMTATGAKGKTRNEILRVLHLPPDDRSLASGDLSRYFTHPRKDYELAVANAIWGQKGHGWRPEWIAVQMDRFGSGFLEADFRSSPDTERQRINQWVEKQTHNRIKELLLPPQITRRTVMVLANAVYFKAKWVIQLDPKKTRDDLFHLADGERVMVPMMHGEVKCGYKEIDGMKMVELPYKGGELSMVVILPKLPDGVPAIEAKLTPKNLSTWIGQLKDRDKMEVSLPRFRLETRYELPEKLVALGMVEAFGPADFSGMAPGDHSPISGVTHKAFVDVNEEGTEAAAATAIVRSDSADPLPFRAEHPFIFLVRDVKHGAILFMGRVMNPKV
jgi:serpin B